MGTSMYTYFIMSPGAQLKSFVQYGGGEKGNYIKFGEATDLKTGVGVRNAYLTHNPDLAVAALMDSTVFSTPYLGTQLKTYIIKTCGIGLVGDMEWFSIKTSAAWGLFGAMQLWDKKKLTAGDLVTLQMVISKYLA
jgi:hypothetical protein